MEMHKIDFSFSLTGSKLFDAVMYNTAKKLCADFPGLEFDYETTSIRIYGELDDYRFQEYQRRMFLAGGKP